MAKLSPLLLLFSLVCVLTSVAPALARLSRSRAYIEMSCHATRFPDLCIQCLSGYANGSIQNPQQLAQAALAVSLYKATYTRAYIIKVARDLKAMKARDYQAVKDCVDQIDNGIDQLTQSIRELRRLGQETVGDDLYWHISNVEAWVGTALTDTTTCLDEFPGNRMGKTKAVLKGKVLNVAMATSNALALFHRFAVKYGARATTNP
ncbi:pectinesterase inhibitor 9-like [Rhodamnia argentea]|uniref:Pectinesterase inhibitor 9-like n=1 Tax=Rhodamnia argentea TaxID=178133 RepID=A0A8B8PMA0_9MYRT|nr:pectinesterase inhibitor 9-like [Rhodamnia argentea]